MKIAVIADVHSNLVGLEAVTTHIDAWQPDQVIVAGDLVNRGPRPLECLRFVQEREKTAGWMTLRGNHEEYVLEQGQPDFPRQGVAAEVHLGSYWTYLQLGDQVTALQAMPFELVLEAPPGSGLVRATHASMLGLRNGIYPWTSEEELELKIGSPPPALFIVGHTHIPLIRRLDGAVVVNAGSAGLPFDEDTRPSYARCTWQDGEWQAEIVRVDYDFPRAEQDFFTSGFLDQAGLLAHLVLQELREARSFLGGWVSRYRQRTLDGEISMEQSIAEFLQSM